MPRINLAQYFPERSAPRTPGISQHALDAEFQAGRNVVGAAADAVGTVADLDRRIREAREASERGDLELRLRTGLGDFMAEMKNDTSFDTWGPRWEKRMSEIVQAASSKSRMTAQGQRELRRMVDNFKVTSASMVNNTRRAKEVDVAGKVLQSNLAADIAEGDGESAVKRIDEAIENQVISKEAGELEKSTLPARLQESRFNAMILTDPRRALELVRDPASEEFAALDPKTRRTLTNIAESKVNAERAALFRDIGRFVSAGIDHHNGTFNDLLRRAVETEPNFTVELADRIRDNASRKVRGGGGVSASRSALDMFTQRLTTFDPYDHEARVELMKLLAQMNPVDGMKASRMFSIADHGKSPLQSPVGVIAMEAARRSWSDQAFGSYTRPEYLRDENGKPLIARDEKGRPLVGADGNPIFSEKIVNGRVEMVTDVNAYAAAQERYSNALGALYEWLSINPKGTPGESVAFWKSTVEAVMGDAAAPLDMDFAEGDTVGVNLAGKEVAVRRLLTPGLAQPKEQPKPPMPRVKTIGDFEEWQEHLRSLRDKRQGGHASTPPDDRDADSGKGERQ